MDYCDVFSELINSFHDIRELEQFASFHDLLDDPQVRARLNLLRDRDIRALVSEIEDLNNTLDYDSIFPSNDVAEAIIEHYAPVPTDVTNIGEPAAKKSSMVWSNQIPQTGRGVTTPEENAVEGTSKPYYIWKKEERVFKKNMAKDTTYKVKFDDQWQGDKLADISEKLHDMFDDVLQQARGHDADLGRVVIHHPDLNDPILVPLQPWENLNASTVVDEISKVLNSNEELHVNESMMVTVGSIDVPKGGYHLPITQLTGPGNSLIRKRSIFYIQNDNNLCLAIAIGLCFLKTCKQVDSVTWNTLVSNDTSPRLDQIMKHKCVPKHYYQNLLRRKNNKMQTALATELCHRAEVPTTRYLGLNDIPPFESLLDVNIFVISSRVGDKFVRATDNVDRRNIYVYHVETEREKHWHGIANIQGFFKADFFCTSCLQPFKDKHKHSCLNTCNVCLSQSCPITDVQMSCRSCGRRCRSIDCFQRHKSSRDSGNKTYPPVCDTHYQCRTCRKVIKYEERDPVEHVCGEFKCNACQRYHVGNHLCYQRATCPSDPKQAQKKFIFYDFETRQDERMQCKEGYSPSKIRCRDCTGMANQCAKCGLCQNCGESSCGLSQHKVNFAVLQTSCSFCEKRELTPEAKCGNCGKRCLKCCKMNKKGEFEQPLCKDKCGQRESVFRGEDAAAQFCSYITQEQCKNSILIAHNAKSFDLYPVLETLIDRHSIKPDNITYNGSKIMYMHVAHKLNLTFLDSLNFLPMKLAKIPDAFGLEEMSKGYFPHFWNRKENQTYRGPYPGPEEYGYNTMSSGERAKFLEWYETKKNDIFDFSEEMLKYCRSDVDILRRGCLEFRQMVMDVTQGVDPFDYVTIASLCMGIFKTLFLKEEQEIEIRDVEKEESAWYSLRYEDGKKYVRYDDEWMPVDDLKMREELKVGETRFAKSPIGVVPSMGYVPRDNYSKTSIQWLEWVMESSRRRGKQIQIQHALNGGEYNIPNTNYRCDGYDKEQNTIYEFYGCSFHGCDFCFPHERSSTLHPSTKQSIEELYVMTKKREKTLRTMGYKLVTIWEHQFHQQIKTDKKIRDFVNGLDVQERLNPRDSFFGGRTNALKLHYKAKDDETIQYYDFTSLYPWTNKYCRYPLGHPKIITDNFVDISNYFGLAKVKILPPRGLYHPVLPYLSNKKLKFPLCRSCADTECTHDCVCSDEKRAITGTWCTPEIQMAVSKGYKILKMYEVYHFEETTQYDKSTGEGGLFAKYVNMFLKFKQQSSGFPSECTTDAQKQEYIKMYKENEGIELDYNQIKKNPGLRCLAKLCLNSFWGKFGQRLGMQKSQFVHECEVEDFFKLLSDPTKEVSNFHIVARDMLQIEWREHPLFLPFDAKTNIFLASFTTAWARLKLYSVLDVLGENVLYFDTDSVIFKCQNSDDLSQLPIGNYLGELTNEISPKDGHIVEYVSGGPKNYAYRTLSGNEVCKVRGFTLNWTNSKLINFEAIKNMICSSDRIEGIVLTNPCKISRHARKRKLYNKIENKKYQMVYTKRRILDNLDTLPFGY